jgi:hypothetical protein
MCEVAAVVLADERIRKNQPTLPQVYGRVWLQLEIHFGLWAMRHILPLSVLLVGGSALRRAQKDLRR